jgi:murein L,D-transpeptidase YcbB/YkuD
MDGMGTMMRRLIPLSLCFAFAAACGGVKATSDNDTAGTAGRHNPLEANIQQILQNGKPPDYVTRDAEGMRLWKQTRAFYEKRNFDPAWIDDGAPRGQMDAFIRAVHSASDEGLDPELYSASMLDARHREASKGFLTKKGFKPQEATAMDVWLTWLYMKYASDLADGISDLAHADPKWQIKPEAFDPLATLEGALRDNRIEQSLQDLVPKNPEYTGLKKTLAAYRQIASKGGWPQVPPSAKARLKPGQTSALVPALAARLAATGDYSGSQPAARQAAVYGPDVQEAVKRFQRRHGLEDDGVVAPPTLAEMNVPVEERIRQIEWNMERWRWLPRDLGERYILVNIPEMRLDVRDHGDVPLSMRVVVGKPDTQTPIFNDQMTHIVFAPYWNVPPDIAEKETMPSMMRDPAFLSRMNMEIVDAKGNPVDPGSVDLSNPAEYRFRQRPGTSNALGLVKFMFPNQFDVYLHDTPADSLFARASRSFSHGCVRLEQPEQLAQYVLRDQPEWTPEKITEAMHTGQEQTVKLKEPLPVYLGYWTARVTPDGIVQFRKDVYGIDARLGTKLTERLERMRRSADAAETAVPAASVKQKKH